MQILIKRKKAGVTFFISDTVDLRAKKITRDSEGYYIMIKGSVHQEDMAWQSLTCTQ